MRTPLLIVCLFTIVFLNGCVSTTYGIYEDERSFTTILDDKALSTAVKGRLMDEEFGEGFSVSVYTFNEHVYLVGDIVPEFRKKAFEIAKTTGGVKKVTAHWFTKPSESTTQNLALSLDVTTALIGTKGISSTQIERVVHNGNVVLLGVVKDKEMATRVINVVRDVPGVKDIRSYLIY